MVTHETGNIILLLKMYAGGDVMVMYSEDEIPKDLVIGETYTERQIYLFLHYSRKEAAILSEDKSRFDDENRTTVYEILSAEDTFVHAKGPTIVNIRSHTKVYRIKMIR